MNKLLSIPLALALAVPTVAFAGSGEKCTHEVQDCLNKMVKSLKTTGFIGVELEHAKDKETLVVTKVVAGAPAEKAGIQAGDVLVALDGIPFTKEGHKRMAEVKKPGREVTCTIRRGKTNKDLRITLVPMPADMMAKYIGEHMMSHAGEKVAAATP